jgi:hypothetical protein
MLGATMSNNLDQLLALREEARRENTQKKGFWQPFAEDARVAEALARAYGAAQVKVINSGSSWDVSKAEDRDRIHKELLAAERGAHLEMQSASDAWGHEAMSNMSGYETQADLSKYGLQLRVVQGRCASAAPGATWRAPSGCSACASKRMWGRQVPVPWCSRRSRGTWPRRSPTS